MLAAMRRASSQGEQIAPPRGDPAPPRNRRCRAPTRWCHGDVTRYCSKTSGSSTDQGGGGKGRGVGPDTLKHLTRHVFAGRAQVVSRTRIRVPRAIAASGQKKRPRIGGLSRDMLVRMSSRPPFTPEPQKGDVQILVPNYIAGEAVVRIFSSNSFDRCNYATPASDRRVHGVFNWCPRSNSRTVNSPRPGRVASPPTPLPPCPAVQG